MKDDEFQKLVINYVKNHSIESFCDDFKVSRQAVKRWVDGKNLPLSFTKERVIKFIRERTIT